MAIYSTTNELIDFLNNLPEEKIMPPAEHEIQQLEWDKTDLFAILFQEDESAAIHSLRAIRAYRAFESSWEVL